MRIDIREILKGITAAKKELPASHRQEFIEKLHAAKKGSTKGKITTTQLVRIAASILVLVSVTYTVNVFYGQKTKPQISAIEQQINSIEVQYLQQIDDEWQKFLSLTDDQNLIVRYENKLSQLDSDYQEISLKFKNNINNISIIEALVENLQTRLQLLKDIQEHIQLLNQENEAYENTI